MTFLGIITILLLIVLLLVLFLGFPFLRRRSQTRHQQIGAEIWAVDVLEAKEQDRVLSAPKVVVRKGRLVLFLLASLSFLSFLALLLLFFLGRVGLYLPSAGFLLSLVFFSCLRYLAIQDIKKRADRRSQLSEEEVSPVVLPPAHAEHYNEPLASEGGGQQVKPIKHTQQKPVNYASKSLRYARLHHESAENTAGSSGEKSERPEVLEVQEGVASMNLDVVLSRRRGN